MADETTRICPLKLIDANKMTFTCVGKECMWFKDGECRPKLHVVTYVGD